jgi:SAM-dependent methyltransferase
MEDILISEDMIRTIAEAETDFCRNVRKCDPYVATRGLASNYKEILKQIELLLGKKKLSKAKVLEIGSGNCFTLCYLAKNGIDVVGIEPGNTYGFMGRYLRGVQLLTENGIYNPGDYLFDASAENLPFANNTFDFVFTNAVLEHVQNIELSMQEALRVLKPNGIFWASVPNYNSWYEAHYNIVWIPYILTKRLAKLYVSIFFNRDPAYISDLIFTNPSMFKKYLQTLSSSGQIYLQGKGLAGRIFSLSNWYLNDELIPNANNFCGIRKEFIRLVQNEQRRKLILLPFFYLSKLLQFCGLSSMFDIIIHKK